MCYNDMYELFFSTWYVWLLLEASGEKNLKKDNIDISHLPEKKKGRLLPTPLPSCFLCPCMPPCFLQLASVCGLISLTKWQSVTYCIICYLLLRNLTNTLLL